MEQLSENESDIRELVEFEAADRGIPPAKLWHKALRAIGDDVLKPRYIADPPLSPDRWRTLIAGALCVVDEGNSISGYPWLACVILNRLEFAGWLDEANRLPSAIKRARPVRSKAPKGKVAPAAGTAGIYYIRHCGSSRVPTHWMTSSNRCRGARPPMPLSKGKRERRRHPIDRFILLQHFLLDSPAWLTMEPTAKALLLDVWRRYNGRNNGEISYAVREAKRLGLSRSAAGRAFDQLIERGFLRVAGGSSFTLKTKTARTWRLTMQPAGGAGPTSDFMRWSPSDAGQEIRTQSQGRDAQSHRRDANAQRRGSNGPDEIILPVSVSPTGPSDAVLLVGQSHQRDTSNIPSGQGIGSYLSTPPQTDCTPALPHETSRSFGAWIADRRKATGRSQADIATAVGIVRSTLANIEVGRYSASAETRRRLVDLFGGDVQTPEASCAGK